MTFRFIIDKPLSNKSFTNRNTKQLSEHSSQNKNLHSSLVNNTSTHFHCHNKVDTPITNKYLIMRQYIYGRIITSHKRPATQHHSPSVIHEFSCLLSGGACWRISNASSIMSLTLLCCDLMTVVLSVRSLRVSVVLWVCVMCCLGAPSLRCMVRRLDSEVVVTPM